MKKLAILFLIVSFFGCDEKYPFETGMFPEEPRNLLEMNSEYDEMNSDYNPPAFDQEVQFIYSSNVKSKGGDFDFESRFLRFIWNKETGVLTHSVLSNNAEGFQNFYNQVQELQTDCNEKGPYSYYETRDGVGLKFILFSRDCEGKYQIVGRDFSESVSNARTFSNEYTFRLFEEESNEMYPSFLGESFRKDSKDLKSNNPEWMVFASDKSGDFNIYQLKIPANQNPIDFLSSDSQKEIQNILNLNSPANDHSPFVSDKVMIFASDRSGGYGGYDLYYSIFNGTSWTEAENFGPNINSEFDDFRPILVDQGHYGFENNLMIFSSNRPGGLGGFDLYFVGIPKF